MDPHVSARSDGGALDQAPRAWFSIAILLTLTILSYVDRSIISLMIEPIKADLAISDVQISLLQGMAFALLYTVASVPMGYLGDRTSRRAVIFWGATAWSLATAACGLARSFGHLFAARVAVGAGEATLSPSAYALVADLFPPQRLAFAIGVLATGAAIGSALALIIGGLVVSWAQTVPPIMGLRSWQLVFVVVGLPGLIIAPLVFLIPRAARITQTDAVTNTPKPQYARWLATHAGYIVPLSIGAGFQAALAIGVTAWTPAYFQREFGYSVATIGLMLGLVMGGGGIIGFAGGGWLVDRLGAMGVRNPHSIYLIAAATLTTLVGGLAFTVVTSIPVLLAMIGLLHMLMPFTGPALAQLQAFTPRVFRARTVAIFMLVFNLVGMVLGPSTVALLTEKVLGGPEHVGTGMALTVFIFGPAAVVMLLFSARSASRLTAAMAPDAEQAAATLVATALPVAR
jgi:MFS family permease